MEKATLWEQHYLPIFTLNDDAFFISAVSLLVQTRFDAANLHGKLV